MNKENEAKKAPTANKPGKEEARNVSVRITQPATKVRGMICGVGKELLLTEAEAKGLEGRIVRL